MNPCKNCRHRDKDGKWSLTGCGIHAEPWFCEELRDKPMFKSIHGKTLKLQPDGTYAEPYAHMDVYTNNERRFIMFTVSRVLRIGGIFLIWASRWNGTKFEKRQFTLDMPVRPGDILPEDATLA